MPRPKRCPICLKLHNRTSTLCDTCYLRRQRELDARILQSPQKRSQLPRGLGSVGPIARLYDFNRAVVSDIQTLHNLIIDPISRIDNLVLRMMNNEEKLKFIENSITLNDLQKKLEKINSSFAIRVRIGVDFDYNDDLFYLERFIKGKLKNKDKPPKESSKWNSKPIDEDTYQNPIDKLSKTSAWINYYGKGDSSKKGTEVFIEVA